MDTVNADRDHGKPLKELITSRRFSLDAVIAAGEISNRIDRKIGGPLQTLSACHSLGIKIYDALQPVATNGRILPEKIEILFAQVLYGQPTFPKRVDGVSEMETFSLLLRTIQEYLPPTTFEPPLLIRAIPEQLTSLSRKAEYEASITDHEEYLRKEEPSH